MKRLLFILSLILLTNGLQAQIFNPVKWETSTKQVSDTEFDLIFTATIDEHWVVYSQFIGEGGPVPTGFYFDKSDHFETVGKVKEAGNKKTSHDKVFNMELTKFYDKGIFTQRIKISDLSKPVTGYYEFMTCDDKRCLPPTEVDFSFALKAEKKKTPTPVEETKKVETKTIEASSKEKSAPASIENNQTTSAEDSKPQIEEKIEEAEAIDFEFNDENKIIEPVKWTATIEKPGDGLYNIVFTAEIEEGWGIYSQHTPEGGPIPTYFSFEKGTHYEPLGEIIEEGDKKDEFDKTFRVNVIKFPHGPVRFIQKVNVKDASVPVKGFMEYMACDDSKCVGPFELDFNINFSTFKASIGSEAVEIPKEGTNTNVKNGEYDPTVVSLQNTQENPIGDCGEKEEKNRSLLWTFIFGFLGGLLALLTPCVFPMIPLTVSFFTKTSKTKAEGIRNALIYGASIIVIYVAIGLLITGLLGPTALQDLSTNWIANTLFFVLFTVFAISFFGYFEITLPSSWSTKSDSMSDKGGLIGIFFMAFTLAIVSFSCTGPIIGSALVQSATDKLGPFIVMLGFSSALALPFALFAAFPGWLNSLPKSGGWMTSVKVVLGFLELALAFKFLSVADMTSHWGILQYEPFMILWIIIFGAMALYLHGFIKFPHDNPGKQKLSIARWGFAGLVTAFTIYLATGFTYNEKTEAYNSLSLVSGLAPPTHYNIFLDKPEVDPEIKARFPSYTKCANNLDCFHEYAEGVAYAKEQNKPILIDFTGYGCVNCRKTEDMIWVKDKVWTTIKEKYILISLYTDDREKLETPLFSKHQQKKLRTVGSLWQDFQIVNFKQNSQPLYVLATPGTSGEVKVMANPRGYDSDSKAYVEFLECGLETFNQLNTRIGMED